MPPAVAGRLAAFGRVVRIAGEDPLTNALAFARYRDPTTGFGWGITTPCHNLSFLPIGHAELVVAAAALAHRGKHTGQAHGASTRGKHAPMLWTSGEALPEPIRAYLQAIRPTYTMTPAEGPFNQAVLMGDTHLLAPALQAEIDALLEIAPAAGPPPHGPGERRPHGRPGGEPGGPPPV